MKGIKSTTHPFWSKVKFWNDKSAKILEDMNINLLETVPQANAAVKNLKTDPDGLANLCWAINSFEDIHGIAYAKAVYERLDVAALRGREGVIKELGKIAKDLERNFRFW